MSNKLKLLLGGALAGLIAAVLAATGNPGNMAICIACFLRDTAGALKFHGVENLQYFRPEVVGLIAGSFIISLMTKEYKSTGGSSPVIRFFLGIVMMIGALVFLGCPTRMVIRMSSGDISAWLGLIGFVGGVFTGSLFLKRGFSLGRNYTVRRESGFVLPIVAIILFILSVATVWFAASTKAPGSVHAPIAVSLIGGLLFGALAQRVRMCFGGAVRDAFLLKNFELLSIIGGFFLVMLIYNIATNNFAIKAFGPIAHAQTLWNILGLYVVGFAAVLLGGCPLRQLILAGQGSNDSALTVLGMFFGAAICHIWKLAAGAASAKAIGGPGLSGKVAIGVCIVSLFIVAFAGLSKSKK